MHARQSLLLVTLPMFALASSAHAQDWMDSPIMIQGQPTAGGDLGFGTAIAKSPDGTRVAISEPLSMTVNVYLWNPDTNTPEVEAVLHPFDDGDPAGTCSEYSEANPGTSFGTSIAMNASWLFVGASNFEGDHGAVYTYELDGGQWTNRQVVRESPRFVAAAEHPVCGGFGATFGTNVVALPDGFIAGAHYYDRWSALMGSAFVFRREGSLHVQTQKITPADAASAGERRHFSIGMTAFGDRVAFSQRWDQDGATRVVSIYRADASGEYQPENRLLGTMFGSDRQTVSGASETSPTLSWFGNYMSMGHGFVVIGDTAFQGNTGRATVISLPCADGEAPSGVTAWAGSSAGVELGGDISVDGDLLLLGGVDQVQARARIAAGWAAHGAFIAPAASLNFGKSGLLADSANGRAYVGATGSGQVFVYQRTQPAGDVAPPCPIADAGVIDASMSQDVGVDSAQVDTGTHLDVSVADAGANIDAGSVDATSADAISVDAGLPDANAGGDAAMDASGALDANADATTTPRRVSLGCHVSAQKSLGTLWFWLITLLLAFRFRRFASSWLIATAIGTALSIATPASAQHRGRHPPTAPTAQASAQEREARTFFDLATQHYNSGRFAEAATEFQRAYDLSPHAALLNNLYLARRDMGDSAGAAAALRRYLAEDQTLTVEQREMFTHRAEALEADAAQEVQEVQRTAQQTQPVVQAQPIVQAPVVVEPVVEQTVAPSAGTEAVHTNYLPAALVFGGGALLIAGSIVTAVLMNNVSSTYNASCSLGLAMNECPIDYAQESAANEFNTLKTTTIIVGAAGIVALGVGVAMLLTVGPEHEAPVRAGLGCDQNGCVASMSGRM